MRNTLQDAMVSAYQMSKWHTNLNFTVVRDEEEGYKVINDEPSNPELIVYIYSNGIRTTPVLRTTPHQLHTS